MMIGRINEDERMNEARQDHTPSVLFRRSGVRYEVACDVIGALVAHFAEAIGRERDRPTPDTPKIAHAQQLVAELKDIREDLDPKDSAAIEGTIERLAPLARHLYQDAEEGSQAARRAAQFVQANASLALEGLPASIDDLAIQARIIRGDLSPDQAVALYERRSCS
jgi:hypothetical protein